MQVIIGILSFVFGLPGIFRGGRPEHCEDWEEEDIQQIRVKINRICTYPLLQEEKNADRRFEERLDKIILMRPIDPAIYEIEKAGMDTDVTAFIARLERRAPAV